MKNIHERFARLGVISSILRNSESRQRYFSSPLPIAKSHSLKALFTGTISSTKTAFLNGVVLDTITRATVLVLVYVLKYLKITLGLTLCMQAVLIFLAFFTSGLQYTVQKMNYKRDLERVEYIVEKAKAAAWGPKMIPIAGKRKVKTSFIQYIFWSLTSFTRRFESVLVEKEEM